MNTIRHFLTTKFNTRFFVVFITLLAALTLWSATASAQVSVTATAGTLGPTPYTTVGGAFTAINAGTHQGAITINITADTAEGATQAILNSSGTGAASYTSVLIKPSGGVRTIAGATSGAIGLIKLNGADNVTIDGSQSGGTDHSLNITNGNTGGTVIWIASASATDGATGNTIKNCNISGPTGVVAVAGILAGNGTTLGNAASAPNSNNTIQNNTIFRVQNSFYSQGFATAPFDQNWVISGNTFGSTVAADKNVFRGMLIGNVTNMSITNNTIQGVVSTATSTATMSGIQIAFATSGGSITRNKISDIKQTNTAGWGSNGIFLAQSSTTANLLVANNFIWDVASFGFADVTAVDNGYGIFITSGGGYNLYHNSVNMNTNQSLATGIPAAINIGTGVTTANSIDLRNNIFSMSATVGTRYAIYSAAANTVYSNIDFNDYFTTQNVGFIGGSARATLANWQTGTGKDASSKSVSPVFVSATDLHLQSTSTLLGVGTTIAAVTNDIDNDPRPASNPDIGADELVQATGGSIGAGTYYNVSNANGDTLGGNVTVTNTLWLGGILNTGANTLTVDCNGTISGASASNYVVGNLAKNYCATGAFNYAVGTNGANPGYSPVNATVTALGTNPSSLTVKATDGPQPNVDAATSIKRYWTLTETGDLTANLVFNYLDPQDIMGNEANYKPIRVSGGTPVSLPGSVNTAANTASITGVSNFSDWTVGEGNAPTSAPVSISGLITDAGGQPLGGVVLNLSGAKSGRAITDAAGRYRFGGLETNGFYTVMPSMTNFNFNPSSRSYSLTADSTDASFSAEASSVPGGNPLDTELFFVRQNYLDFLGREPDVDGLNYWAGELELCGGDAHCMSNRRIDVSAAFFKESEFQDSGSFIYRLYKGALGRQTSYAEFSADRRGVIGGVNLEQSKAAFADSFVQRAEFINKYSSAQTAESFVSALIATMQQSAGVDLSGQRDAFIAKYQTGASLNQSRSLVVREAIEAAAFKQAVYNSSFVLMEYYGYLKRDPDEGGFNFWLNVLNNREPNNYRGMVCSFLTSAEYQKRFSSVATHSNSECGQ